MSASSGSTTRSALHGGSPIARLPDAREVAVDVAYRGIELCERDGEMHWCLAVV